MADWGVGCAAYVIARVVTNMDDYGQCNVELLGVRTLRGRSHCVVNEITAVPRPFVEFLPQANGHGVGKVRVWPDSQPPVVPYRQGVIVKRTPQYPQTGEV
jgi:hypothetical protein